jgi:hypothetical protein
MIDLSTTNSPLKRSVECEQGWEKMCEFCIEMGNCFTCYDLENSTSRSAANAALTGLEEETYFYRATAYLNDDVPVVPSYGFFSTGKLCFFILLLNSLHNSKIYYYINHCYKSRTLNNNP